MKLVATLIACLAASAAMAQDPGAGKALFERGILYAPDYVINAGGIISVATEYLARRDGHHASKADVNARIEQIPARLEQVWQTSQASGTSPDIVADQMAQELIGRGAAA